MRTAKNIMDEIATEATMPAMPDPAGVCRVCGCTDIDCRGCIARTGRPCYWVYENLCSACARYCAACGTFTATTQAFCAGCDADLAHVPPGAGTNAEPDDYCNTVEALF